MSNIRPFHLAFPVDDLEAARNFYGGVLQCEQGREDSGWIDYNLFGHQIVAHLNPDHVHPIAVENPVDGDSVPVPHFGVVLNFEQFDTLKSRLEANADTRWIIRPKTRFEGQPGEQRTMFFLDPAGNALEFKAFANDDSLFAV